MMIDMKRMLLSFVMMTMVGIVQGQVAKVIKTEVKGIDWGFDGMSVNVNVKMQLANVRNEECVCLLLLNNARWNEANMTFEKLRTLNESLCFGGVELPAINASTMKTFGVDVLLEKEYLTGEGSSLYLKAYVLNKRTQKILAEGQTIKYDPDVSALRKEAMGSAIDFATSIFGAILGGGSSTKDIPEGCSVCSYCRGDGKCSTCSGTGKTSSGVCSSCGGNEYCKFCGGKGYTSGW